MQRKGRSRTGEGPKMNRSYTLSFNVQNIFDIIRKIAVEGGQFLGKVGQIFPH